MIMPNRSASGCGLVGYWGQYKLMMVRGLNKRTISFGGNRRPDRAGDRAGGPGLGGGSGECSHDNPRV